MDPNALGDMAVGQSTDPYTQQLLDLAKQQGGATAQTASQIVHPNDGFLSMTRDKLGTAFHGVMDALATPEETLAAGMSDLSGNPISLKQAYQQHVQPSQILFGKGPATSTLGKVAKFGAGFVTDTLLDPLTYVTTGRYSGLFGLSKLPDIPIGKEVAKGLGWTNIFKGSNGWEAVRHATLSEEGNMVRSNMIKSATANIARDTLESAGFGGAVKLGLEGAAEVIGEGIPVVDIADTALIASQAAKAASTITKGKGIELATSMPGVGRYFNAGNIRARIGKSLFGMAGMAPEDIMKATTGPGAEGLGAMHLAKVVKDMELAKGTWATMSGAERDAWGAAINKATTDSMQDQAERLVRHTLQARASDIELQVNQEMKNILEKNAVNGNTVVDKLGNPVKDQFGNTQVRNLAQAWLDKGGVKVFGKSVVSGARIKQMMNTMIPAEDRLASFGPTATKTLAAVSDARNRMASLFSTKYNVYGRVPDTVLQVMRNFKFKQDAQMSEFINNTGKMMERMNISPDEMRTVMAAVATGKRPAEAPSGRTTALYDMLHSNQGNKVMGDIANGVYGDGTKPEDMKRMWNAANYVKKQLQQNLVMMRDAGMSVYEHENYVPLLLNETKKAMTPFLKTKSSQAINATKGEFNKFTNVEDPTKVLFGTEADARDATGASHNLTQYTKVEERNRINKQINDTVLKSKTKTDKIKAETEDLWNDISEKHTNDIMSGAKEVVGEASEDRNNRKALENAIRDSIPAIDRKRVLENSVASIMLDHAPEKANLTTEDIDKLKEDLKTGDEDLDTVASYVSNNLDKFGITVKKAATGTAKKTEETNTGPDLQAKLAELKKIIKESAIKGKTDYLKEALNKPEGGKSLSNVLQGVSDTWHDNPGVNRLVKKILNKNEELHGVLGDMSDTKDRLQNELKQPGLKRVADRWYYKDSEGATYERERATAEEINKNYFNGEEMFSEDPIKPFLASTENTLRTVNTKNLMGNVAEKFGIPASEAPSNYVSVSISSMADGEGKLADFMAKQASTKKLESLMYHPAVAQTIVDMMRVMDKDPASGMLLDGFDKLTNLFKVSVTAPFLAFHGRNAISNVWQSMMDIGYHSLSPAKHMMAMKLQGFNKQLEEAMMDLHLDSTPEKLQKYFEIADKEILTDKAGHTWTAGELDRVLRDNVVAYNPSILGMMDSGLSTNERFEQVSDALFAHTNKWGSALKKANPASQKFFLFEQGRNLSNYLESEPRILNFLANLENTGDVSFAAHQTKQFLYDHTNLTSFERNFLRRVVPFYAYTRKNIEGMVQTMIHKPGRIDWFRNTYTNIGDAFAGGNLTREEREALPEWMRDSLDMVVARNGNNVKLITSMGSPFEAPFDEIGNLMGSLNPIIKGPVEQTTGYSFFEGKPLSQVTDATAFKSAPQAVKNFIGFTEKQYTDSAGVSHTQYVALNPRMMNVFNNLPLTSRTLSAMAQLQNPNLDVQNKILATLFGIKPTEINLGTEEFQRQKELDQQIEKILSDSGVGYQRTEYTAPTGTSLPNPPTLNQ